MARLPDADGGDDLQIWRVAADILKKQSRTADKGWHSSLMVGQGISLRNVTQGLGIGFIWLRIATSGWR
jgi:hypothetical protein